MLFNHLKKTYSLLDKNQRYYAIFVLLIFLIQMFLELFSVALFIPLISFLTETDLSRNTFYIFFKNNLNIDLSFLLINFNIFIFFFIGIFLIRSLMILFCNWIKIKFILDIRLYLLKRLFKNYLSLPYEKFISKNSSLYIKNMSYENDIVAEGVFQFLEFISELIIITGIFIFLLFFNFKISLISFFIVAFFFTISNLFTRKRLKSLGDKVRNHEQFRIKNFIESFNLIKEIKIFNMQNFFESKNINFNKVINYNTLVFRFLKVVPSQAIELILVILISSITVLMIGEYSMQYTLTLLGVFFASAMRLLPSVKKLFTAIQYFSFSSPATDNISKELSNINKNTHSNQISIKSFKNKIIFFNVNFKFRGSNNLVLKNFNLEIPSKKIIGIKGSTGSGKSTIVNLISGLIYPSSGSIFIDDIDYKDISLNSLNNLIGYVPQNVYLMDSSIKDNICFGSNKFTQNDLNDSIKKSNLEKFISELPNGIETIIGEKSSKISGGQAQRIGIARALIKKPSILILDEATNSLDFETEKLILDTLESLKGQLTIIFISHTDNTFRICDKVIDLNKH